MLTRIPLSDAYDTVLAQPLSSSDGAGAYVYCSAVPAVTFPSGFTTSLRVDPGNGRSEEIEVDQVDIANKRWRIKSRNLAQGEGITTSAQAHPTGARVIISDSFAFWKAIVEAVNAYTGPFATYADDAARDAAIPSPLQFQFCANVAAGAAQVFVGSNWENLATGDDEATTRECTAAEALNGEFFRDIDDGDNLKFKTSGGTVYSVLVDATGKLSSSVYDFSADATGTETTKPVNSAGVKAIMQNAADGDISGALTITGANDSLIVKSYRNFIPGANTVTITPTGCVTVIKVSGNLDLTGTTINWAGKGKLGGTGATGSTAATAGGIQSFFKDTAAGITAIFAGAFSGGAGGAGNLFADGGVGGAAGGNPGGTAGTVSLRPVNKVEDFASPYSDLLRYVAQGGAGAGKSSGAASKAGDGGAGGGTVIFLVEGNVTLSGTTVTVAGSNGGASVDVNGGGGGGGSGGLFALFYKGTLSGSVTPTVTGGTGGASTGGAAGGAGGARRAAGTVGTAGGGSSCGGGGGGAGGDYVISKF